MKPKTPRPSNVLTYAIVAVFCLGALGFMYLLFGELFVYAVVVFGVVGAVGCMHYLLWGRSMTEQAKKDAKAEMDGLNQPG